MKRYAIAACAFLAGGLSVAALLVPLMHRRVTARAVAQDLQRAVRLAEYGVDERSIPIDCWGDSLTEGRGTSPGHDFPGLLGSLFHRRVLNRGIGGETSAQIARRVLSRQVPAYPENAVIWAGRNDDLEDLGAIEGNIDGMVRSLNAGSHVLVLGVLNSDTVGERRGGDRYRAIVTLNEHLKRTYGANFVPIRDILVSQGNAGDEDDRVAMDADMVPPSLRSDGLHLNDQGEALVAYAVETAIRRNGW